MTEEELNLQEWYNFMNEEEKLQELKDLYDFMRECDEFAYTNTNQ